MFVLKYLFGVLLITNVKGSIYRLNGSEFDRMPPLYYIDDYVRCMNQPDGFYCSVDLAVVPDHKSELYQMMHRYSQDTKQHFNYTSLFNGICVSKSCAHIVKESKTADLKSILGRCANESLWNKYKLQANSVKEPYCKRRGQETYLDLGDKAVLTTILLIILVNVVGSAYDIFIKKDDEKGNSFLMCFSVRSNWLKLISTKDSSDPRRDRLKGFHGIRSITAVLIVFAHAGFPYIMAPNNSQDVEGLHDKIAYRTFFNGLLVVQTFFMMSGFLLSYNTKMSEEKSALTSVKIPKKIFLRWLRLSPSYFIVLAFVATWQRHLGNGPFWGIVGDDESVDCRHYWWMHLLFINNYQDTSQCLPHTWHLAADMQLTIWGLIVLILFKGKSQRVLLSILAIAGIIAPMAHTYFEDLDAVVVISPESARSMFTTNETYNKVYKRGHTNLISYVMGIVFGQLVYKWQNSGFTLRNRYKKYRFFYYSLVSLKIGILYFGSVFYLDGYQPPIYVRALYAGLVRPLFTIIIIAICYGMIFKYEGIYRGILEWKGWNLLSKVSYPLFVLHITVIRYVEGNRTVLKDLSFVQFVETGCGLLFISFLLGSLLWLLVEAPKNDFINLVRRSIAAKGVKQ